MQIQSSRLELEEGIPPLVANGYLLSGGNSNKKKNAGTTIVQGNAETIRNHEQEEVKEDGKDRN